ncbi:MAG: DUF72 domain-containing protein [Burkholderiaceae bacterium]
MESNANIYIGCAGWSIPSIYANDPELPKIGSHLERYASVLPAVEINSSFYRSHRPETYARWKDTTPAAFRFSVKMPKLISHEKKLVDIDDHLDRLIVEVGRLEEKLGCLLLQLPPKLKFDLRIAGCFFEALRKRTAVKVMCEPRHPSWFQDDAIELFMSHHVTRVIADPPIVGVENIPSPKSDTAYIRLHGSPDMYRSPYSESYLNELGRWIKQQLDAGLQVWCIFDNTSEGAAFGNALFLLTRMKIIEIS